MSLRSLFSGAALVLCVLLAGIAALDARRQTNTLMENPGPVVAQRGEEQRGVVQTAFERLVVELRKEANRIAELARERSELADVFGLLADENRRTGFTLEYVGAPGTIEAWAGPSVRATGSPERLEPPSGEVAFSKNGFWTFVTVASADGSLLLSSPFASELPLSNKYFQRRNFVDDLSEMLGARPIVLVNGEAPDPALNGYERIPLGAEGSERSIVLLLPSSTRDSLREEIDGQWSDRASMLAAASVVLLLITLWPVVGRVRHAWMRLGLRILVVWSGRAALIATGVSSAFRGEMLFDPTVYGSAFGWGLVATPADALLSLSALFYSVLAISGYRSGRSDRLADPRTAKTGRFVLSAALLAGCSFLFVLFVRGMAAAMRSLVFDSTVNFLDASTVLPDVGAAVLLLAIVLLALGFFGIFLLLVHAMRRFARELRIDSWMHETLLFTLGTVIGVVLLKSLETSSLWPWHTPVVALLTTIGYVYWEEQSGNRLRGSARQWWQVALAWLTASFVLAAPMFYERVQERERIRVESLAPEILQPIDDWLAYVLTDGLRTASTAFAEFPATTHSDGAAFSLWTKTLLGQEGNPSGLVVYDMNGRERDRFVVGIGSYEQKEMLARLFEHEEWTIQAIDRTGMQRGTALSGIWGTILDDRMRPLGTVAVFMAGGPASAERDAAPSPLTPQHADWISPRVYVTEISGDTIRSTMRPDLFVGQSVSGLIAETEGRDRVWIDEPIGRMSTFLVRAPDPEGRIIGLSMAQLDFRWYTFTVLKLFMIYMTIMLLVMIARMGEYLRAGVRVRFSFGQRLFLAFAALSMLPLVILGYANRNVSRERAEVALERTLTRDLEAVARRIETYVSDEEDFARGVTDDFCRAVAAEYDVDFAVYNGTRLLASTRPELFRASLFDRRLEGLAYLESVVRGKPFAFLSELVGAIPYTVGYAPLTVEGKRVGVVAIPTLYRQQEIDEEVAERNVGVFGVYAIVMVIVLAGGSVLASRIAGPIRELSVAARQVGKGEMDVPLNYAGADEVGELTSAFREMTKELQRSRADIVKAEREGAWKEMAKQVAHEIRNPLTPMKLAIQHVRQAFQDDAANREELLQSVIRTVLEQIDALSRIATEFSHFAKMPPPEYARIDVHSVLEESIGVFAGVEGIRFEREFVGEPCMLVADREHLRRVFMNIMRNSVQAMPEGGTIRTQTLVEGSVLTIRISDNGPGIPEAIRKRIFEPNFSTKTEGMGLGLAISRKIIEDLGGTILCESTIGSGTSFVITLVRTLRDAG